MTKRVPSFAPKFTQSAKARDKAYDRWRGTSHSRGYGRAWKKCRDAYVKEFPLCERCSTDDHPVLGEPVHHKIEVEVRPDLLLAWDNLEHLCRACHAKAHSQAH